MSMTLLSIFFAANNAYMGMLATCIASILKNSAESDYFHFYVLHDDIQDDSKCLLEEVKALKEFQIKYIKIASDDFNSIPAPTLPHISKETNYRFYLASTEPNLDKALFLDADLIVLSSLAELWNIDINDYYMACVNDQYALSPNSWAMRLCLPESYTYVNTGVMLANLKKWRQDDIQAKLFKTAETFAPKLLFPDQDTLNITLHKAVLTLNHKWNFMPTQHYQRSDQREEALADTRIIHWAGEVKPWGGMAPYSEMFWQFARLTPFYERLLTRFIWRQGEAINTIQSKIERMEAYLQRIRIAALDWPPHYGLFFKHTVFRLLARITFGKIREQCINKRRRYANRRKALMTFFS